MAKNWETSPWTFVMISVVAGVTTAVVSAAIQKWWGLKLAQKAALAQSQPPVQLGRYQAVY